MNIMQTIRNVSLGTVGGVAILLGLSASANAAVERIDCPVDQLRGAVTTPLPGGWWSTPMVFSLQQARVENVRGRTVLTCDYGAAGTIRRDAPSDACTATRRGFRCTTLIVPIPIPLPIPVPAPAPGSGAVVASGEANLGAGTGFDLDTGTFGGPGADIRTNVTSVIEAINGAGIAGGFGSNRPGLNGCRAAGGGGGSVDLPGADRIAGFAFCVRTTEGRMAEFYIRHNIGGLNIAYTTWNP